MIFFVKHNTKIIFFGVVISFNFTCFVGEEELQKIVEFKRYKKPKSLFINTATLLVCSSFGNWG